jgi:hypothetical protein
MSVGVSQDTNLFHDPALWNAPRTLYSMNRYFLDSRNTLNLAKQVTLRPLNLDRAKRSLYRTWVIMMTTITVKDETVQVFSSFEMVDP